MSGQSAQEKLDALSRRSSNAKTVQTIEFAGRTTSNALTIYSMVTGAVTAYSTASAAATAAGTSTVASGTIAAVISYLGPIASGMAGVALGSWVANKIGADEMLLDRMGAERQVKEPGPEPAVFGHKIAHNNSFWGAIGGLIGGVLAAAAVGLAVAALIGTGGLAAPLIIAGAAGLAGGFVGTAIAGAGAKMANITGTVNKGSPNVFFEGKPVARVTDTVACSKHSSSPPPQIVEGSETISVNSLPLARVGHKITCSAVLQEGCKTIFGDDTTGTYGPIDAEFSIMEQSIISIFNVASAIWSAKSARDSYKSRNDARTFSDPIDPSNGNYCDTCIDIDYRDILPLRLQRVYSGQTKVDGLLGTKWRCSWSQRLIYDKEEQTATLENDLGWDLIFDIGSNGEFNSRHFKAPYYQLTGSCRQASLFDNRTQQTLIYKNSEAEPDIGKLYTIKDQNGNHIKFVYENYQLKQIEHSSGMTFRIQLSNQGYITSIKTAIDNKSIVEYIYDEAGCITNVNSLFNGEINYQYTKEGWLKNWHDSLSTINFLYDKDGRVISTHTPEGPFNDRFVYSSEEKKTKYIDSTGACTTLWFNNDNLLIREEDPLGNITEHEWDSLERKILEKDPLGRIITFNYDSFGNLIKKTDSVGRIKEYKYNDSGLKTEITYADKRKYIFEYDNRGNLSKIIKPNTITIHFSYDENGRLLSEVGSNGFENHWEYDQNGRLISWRDASGQSTGINQDIWGRILSITDPIGHTAYYSYEATPNNPNESLSRITYPDNSEINLDYNSEGLLSVYTSETGNKIRYQYGAFGLLRSRVDPAGYTIKMEYDDAGRLTRIKNPKGKSWKYAYDAAGRLIKQTDWAGRQTIYIRDEIGRIMVIRFPDGIEQNWVWNERGYLRKISTVNNQVVYEYDDSDRLIYAAKFNINKGKEKILENEIYWVYNSRDLIVQEIQNGLPINYEYDDAGRCIKRVSPSGEIKYNYNSVGFVSELQSNNNSIVYERNEMGEEITRYLKHKKFIMNKSYDSCGRLLSQEAGSLKENVFESPYAENQNKILRKYTWNKAGKLCAIKDSKRGNIEYTYDSRDQVKEVKRDFFQHSFLTNEYYSYDELMNLVESNGHRCEYGKGDELVRIGNITYRYDKRGRVIQKLIEKKGDYHPEIWRYIWDDFDLLRELTTPNGESYKYLYDAIGRRIKKERMNDNSHKTKYLWQGATLIEEWHTEASITKINRWHFEPNTFYPIAKDTILELSDKLQTKQCEFFPVVTDHLGTPKEIYNSEGKCIWQMDHTLWGVCSKKPNSTTKAIENYAEKTKEDNLKDIKCNLRFQNQWEDEESGLYYNFYRYYDPDSGQYLIPDPVGIEGGLRYYGYVHDPVHWVDPMGLGIVNNNPKYFFDPRAGRGSGRFGNFRSGQYVSANEISKPYQFFSPKPTLWDLTGGVINQVPTAPERDKSFLDFLIDESPFNFKYEK